MIVFFFQAEDGIRDLVRSRGLGDVYKRQVLQDLHTAIARNTAILNAVPDTLLRLDAGGLVLDCLLYTSDAADERSSVDLGGRRIIKKKTKQANGRRRISHKSNALQPVTETDGHRTSEK